MKKLVFGLVATVAFAVSGFAANDVVVSNEINTKIEKEEIKVKTDTTDYMCVRTCYYDKSNGSLIGCTAWTCYELLPTVTVTASVN